MKMPIKIRKWGDKRLNFKSWRRAIDDNLKVNIIYLIRHYM